MCVCVCVCVCKILTTELKKVKKRFGLLFFCFMARQ